MPRFLTPIRPRLTTDGALSSSQSVPVSSLSPSDNAPEAYTPLIAKSEPVSATLPVEEQMAEHIAEEGAPPNNPACTAWPSEIYQDQSTSWLLPPPESQASAIASLLKAEIQSHNLTREMLHATEQRRLDLAQICNQLRANVGQWSGAYNDLRFTLVTLADNLSQQEAEKTNLYAQLRYLGIISSSGEEQTDLAVGTQSKLTAAQGGTQEGC